MSLNVPKLGCIHFISSNIDEFERLIAPCYMVCDAPILLVHHLEYTYCVCANWLRAAEGLTMSLNVPKLGCIHFISSNIDKFERLNAPCYMVCDAPIFLVHHLVYSYCVCEN